MNIKVAAFTVSEKSSNIVINGNKRSFPFNILSSEPPTSKQCQRYLRTSHKTRINKYFDLDLLPKSGSFYICIESLCSNGLLGIQQLSGHLHASGNTCVKYEYITWLFAYCKGGAS